MLHQFLQKDKTSIVSDDPVGADRDDLDGVGKMFTVRNNIYIDPKIVYNSGEKTTNLTLGFGLKF